MVRRYVYIGLAGIYVLAFLVRVDVLVRAEAAETLALYAGKTVSVEGVVVNDPESRATSLHAYMRVSRVSGEAAEGTLLVLLPREAALLYGDTVRVRGEVSLPEVFETDTGRIFNYPGYLRVRGVSALMRYGTLEYVEAGGVSLQGTLFSIKHFFKRSLERVFPEPNASLLEGVLLGERRGLPEELTNAFTISGLIHVVVLSGYNITIVSEAVLRSLAFLPPAASYSVGAVFIVLFALMTGAGATTVRATIMGLIAILARVVGRPAAALRALALAALLMALWNPLVVLYDPSFVLSVLATFGLITLSPSVERLLGWVPARFGLRSIAASTIAVQLYILPALLYMTGVLSFVAFPANVLALPVVPFAMLFGFGASVLGLLHPMLGAPLAVATNVLLEWMMIVARTAEAVPYAATVVPTFPLGVAGALYVPLTLFAVRMYIGEVNSVKKNP